MGRRPQSIKSRAVSSQAKPATIPAPPGWRAHSWRIAALWVLTLLAYSNAFQSGFVFDNRSIILEDARVHSAGTTNIDRILKGTYWQDRKGSGLYRPVTTFSYLLNYSIFGNGEHPEGYHWINFVLHAINVSLVYAIGLQVFAAPPLAFALAAIWGSHPLLTESVTNIVGRADLLAALGVLAGLLCYCNGRCARRFTVIRILGLAGGQLLGLFSKESAVILIPLMVVYDLAWPVGPRLAKRAPFYGAAALVCAAYFLTRMQLHSHIEVQFIDNPLVRTGFWGARLTAIGVLGRYVWLFLWPAHLSPDYSFNSIPVFSGRIAGWGDIEILISVLLCAAAILAGLRYRRTQPLLFFFLAFFFVSAIPASNLIVLIGSIMAERFAYLPSIGLAGCLVVAVKSLSEHLARRSGSAPRLTWGLMALAVVALAGRTYARNRDWREDASLWTSAVQVCPQSAKAHLNLGRVYLEAPGRDEDAIAEYEAALQIEPDYALGQYSLATALVKAGRTDAAIDHYKAALRLEPDYPQAHNNLGNTLARTPGGLEAAIGEYRAALRLDPSYTEARINLGNALASMPDGLSEAIEEYKAALRTSPDSAAAHYNLGNALMEIPGRLEEAIREYRLALRAQPDFAASHDSLGVALAQVPGHLSEAVTEFESAIRANPEAASAHVNLGIALTQVPDRLRDAIAEFEAAARIDPNLQSAHYQLGMALLRFPGRNLEAIRELETANRIQPDPGLQRMIEHLRGQRD